MLVTISDDPVASSPAGALSMILLEAGPAAIPKETPIRMRPARSGAIPEAGVRIAKTALYVTTIPQAATAKTRRPRRSDQCPNGILRMAITTGGTRRQRPVV